MKRFAQFLIEKTSIEDAMRILGLKPGFTKDDLEKAHKDMVRKYHPDRNPGDKAAAETMARANDAKDVLNDKAGQTDRLAGYERARQETEEKAIAFEEVTTKAMKEHLDLPKFVAHFNRVFPTERFAVTAEKWRDSFKSKSYGNKNEIFHVGVEVEFANSTRTIVLDMHIVADYREMLNSKALAGPESFVSMFIMSDILYNRKKVKLTQQNYKRMDTSSVLSDPEVLFPASKLKSQAGKSTSRKLSKRDVYLTFEKELGASISDQWVYIPIGEFELSMYRSVMTFRNERVSYWSLGSIRGAKPKREQTRLGYASFVEDGETMDWLWNNLRRLKQHPPASAQALASEITSMASEYKTKQEAKKAADQ